MKRLLDGVARYNYETRARYTEQFAALAVGQEPAAMFLTCADSRVVPSLIASSDPGELFVVRNIANLVPHRDDETDASVGAAIAYAVEILGVQDIVVCGHSECGGIKALLADQFPDPMIARWLEQARPFREEWSATARFDPSLPRHDQLSQACTLHQLTNLRTHPSVRAAVATGALRLHAWWFDIGNARLLAHSPELDAYVSLVDEVARLSVA